MLSLNDKKDDKPRKGKQMNKKLKFSLVCLLFIALTSGALAEANLTELVNKIRPAIVTIQTYDQNKKLLGQGTGFFIDIKVLITNYHVLMGANQAEIITHDGRKYPITQVVAENKKMDLIKLLVDIPRSSVSRVNLVKSLPSIAENIVVIGSPFGLEQTVSEGIISGVRDVPKVGRLLQISAPISRGSSGSPVLNMKGEVVGIVTFFLLEGQNLNFAIPAQYLLELKPSETLKTVSEWTGQDVCRLYVHTEPKGARVRILNINPKFFQGIVLKPGRYHIEVSSDGYKTEKTWIRIGTGQDKNLRISLEKKSHVLSEEQILTKTSNLFAKAVEHEMKGEYREAIDTYKECIRIDPDNRLWHMGLGKSYIGIENYREAIDTYKECIRIDPYVPAFHFYIGRCYFSLGLHSQAIDECKLAIQYKPDDEMACKTYILLGGSYGQIGNFAEAIEAFKKAIQIKPDDAFAHFSLGVAYLAHGDRSSALDQYKTLKDLDKEQANKLFNIIYK